MSKFDPFAVEAVGYYHELRLWIFAARHASYCAPGRWLIRWDLGLVYDNPTKNAVVDDFGNLVIVP
jgi:hypothetical protein